MAATELVVSVFALGRAEFTGVLGSFPGDGLLACVVRYLAVGSVFDGCPG